MFKHRSNGVWITKNETEGGLRIALFKGFVDFFPNVKAK